MNPVWIGSGLALIGGIIGAVLAIFKLSPERQAIFITTAQGAVVVQSGVIDDLRDELERLRKRVTACEALEEMISNLRQRIDTIQDKLSATALERDELKVENEALKARVAHLEAEVSGLKNGQ